MTSQTKTQYRWMDVAYVSGQGVVEMPIEPREGKSLSDERFNSVREAAEAVSSGRYGYTIATAKGGVLQAIAITSLPNPFSGVRADSENDWIGT